MSSTLSAPHQAADVDDPVMTASDVAVHYGGIKALDGVSISLQRGRISGVVGPNGSGKSTLLGVITRLTKLTSGSLWLEGRDYTRMSAAGLAKHGLARTFQTVRLVETLSVFDNVLLGADLARCGRSTARARAEECIDKAGLAGSEKAYPSELSYGTQRCVEIARALATRPGVLLLDEPTAGMNHDERQSISRVLVGLRDQGLTQLLVEHDVQMMLDTCDYLFAMNVGKVIAEGPPQDVMKDRAVREAYLGKR